ncbi:MAG: HAD hydrolase-like protein, partial [Thermomicrobiales bacterium]|nr:HAD hydrolase-like protein [Thermomicrobiales bacterium]
MTPRYSTLIFDLDGTLADTLPLIYEAFNDALSPISGEQLSPEEIRGMFGPPDNYIIRELLDAEHHEAAIERYVATYQRRHRDLVDLFDGMADLLADAQAAGTKLAVVTGKSRSTAIMTLDILGVLGHFQVIYAGDDVERQRLRIIGGSHDPRERLTVHPLHREIEHAAFLAELVDLRDVRMLDRRGDARLVDEHAFELRDLSKVRKDRLDRNRPREPPLTFVTCGPDVRHPPARHRCQQLVATETRA